LEGLLKSAIKIKAVKSDLILLIYEGVSFLSKTQRDFLLQKGDINKTQQRYIRYKLRKKIKQFYDNQLPL